MFLLWLRQKENMVAAESKPLEILFSPEVEEQMRNDPKLAEAVRRLTASFRQADHAVKTGQHKTFDEAMEAITGSRPVAVDVDTGEKIEAGPRVHDTLYRVKEDE